MSPEVPAQNPETFDVIIIGGGPAGSVAAIQLARAGRRVVVIEKATFPRWHIGESFLPATFNLIKDLGLEPKLRKLPHVPKFGADFQMGYGGKLLRIDFKDGYCPSEETFNIERGVFDQLLLDEARKAGADVRQHTVKKILQLTDGDVRIETEAGELRAKYLLDASGQSTVVARHLGTRQNVTESHLRKVAYLGRFENVERPTGREEGHPLIAMMDEGWFWMIPLNERVTSVGVVLDADIAKQIARAQSLAPDQMLMWCIERTPVVRERMKNARAMEINQALADFSYHCRPYAGDGYFLIGDAAAFMDPIFSTGVSVAVNASTSAARFVDKILAGQMKPQRARDIYIKQLELSTGTLFNIIRQYYDHSFRELFIAGRGPFGIHKAVIGVLAGNVFPQPPLKIRWRLWLFDYFVRLNKKKQLVTRRRRFSLLKIANQSQPAPAGEPTAISA